MILGILSDTHGEQRRTARALRVLKAAGAEAFAHCGDLGGFEILDELAGLKAWVVSGNVDCPDQTMVQYAASLGLRLDLPPPVRFDLDGRHFALFHGHEREFERLQEETRATGALPAWLGPCDYVLHGHTHMPRASRLGRARVINPGALQRARIHTVATLDVRYDDLRFWIVRDDGDEEPTPYRLPRPF